MSGDERRGTDGGEHPLDVDARFADIIAHFHDGEPAPPRVVDDGDATRHGSTASSLYARDGDDDADGGSDGSDSSDSTDVPGEDGPDATRAQDGPGSRSGDEPFPVDPSPGGGQERRAAWDRGADEAATDWAARYEQAAREELAAHEERTARRAREARLEAEVDRAVDGPGSRFVPEEPPPIPRPADLPGRLAWGAVLLGPVALVVFALVWRTAPPWMVGTVVTAIVAGFGYLVWRLPRTRDRDDGGDGAIV